jgi:hypothetical protein
MAESPVSIVCEFANVSHLAKKLKMKIYVLCSIRTLTLINIFGCECKRKSSSMNQLYIKLGFAVKSIFFLYFRNGRKSWIYCSGWIPYKHLFSNFKRGRQIEWFRPWRHKWYMIYSIAIPVMEFQVRGYKLRNIFS